MKKKFFPLLCALVLCLGLLTTALSAGSTESPCFVAINENLLRLEDQFIPIAISGQYYIPYAVLDSRLTGLVLGVDPIYNSILRTLTVYNREQMLTFDLTDGSCTDRNGVSYPSARAVTRNGRVYIPARFTCEYFGFTYSTIITSYGPMVRIRNSSSVMGDSEYVGQAQMAMENRLREWRGVQNPTTTPTPVPSVPASVPSPTATNRPTNKSDVRTYLTFRVDKTEGLDTILGQLEQNGMKALFFFPCAELADYDAAVRKVLCAGHRVGLLADGTTTAEVTAQAEEGGRLLAQIAHLSTNTVLAPGLTGDDMMVELDAAGFLCLRPDVEVLPDDRTAYTRAAAALGLVEQYRYQVILLFDTSTAGVALIGQVLPVLVRDNYDVRPVLETEF